MNSTIAPKSQEVVVPLCSILGALPWSPVFISGPSSTRVRNEMFPDIPVKALQLCLAPGFPLTQRHTPRLSLSAITGDRESSRGSSKCQLHTLLREDDCMADYDRSCARASWMWHKQTPAYAPWHCLPWEEGGEAGTTINGRLEGSKGRRKDQKGSERIRSPTAPSLCPGCRCLLLAPPHPSLVQPKKKTQTTLKPNSSPPTPSPWLPLQPQSPF